ncbi:SDR family NAD(P)-dependent oxidoreductase [Saccharopolyspora phatthalungensis]|uniref:3-oxoacyl-[acyl-carrier protein] reductase n=1 Tax=Saccharopolyspora phatthalungensis TaxID=664693 RepID=A0A840Q3X6_9PSEU|nr:SDR family NAD(P)-dependent oxidoreductase [Saccharopolyspora phatthalungensis]MBB5157202.1 3-oxoacyl-[acyl-carrier protein] reductase [Saccharopolyspora phatthalungensis]
MNTENKTVLVTGSGQGIGRVLALGLAERGWRVIVADLDGQRAESVAAKAGGEAVTVDISSAESCREAAHLLQHEDVVLDGLVNNAALFSTLTMKPFWEIDEQEWDRVLRVNLTGTWQITTALLPLLRRSAAASIVNIAASAVWIGRSNYAHYVASKAGVIGLTYVMSRELADDGIRANALTPGSVRTEIPRHTITPEQVRAQVNAQNVQRPGTPEDLLGAVAFLLGPDSGFVSGQTLNVDGGLTVR